MSTEPDIEGERLRNRMDLGCSQVSHQAAEIEVAVQAPCVLSEADWAVFLGAIETPLEPNLALRAAITAYVDRRSDG